LLSVDLACVPPQAGKLFEISAAAGTPEFRVSLPQIESIPVRPKMVYAAKPEPVVAVQPEAPAPVEQVPEPAKPAQLPKKDQRRGTPQKPSFKTPQGKSSPKSPEPAVQKPAEPPPPVQPEIRPEIAAMAAVETPAAPKPPAKTQPAPQAAPAQTSIRPSLDLDGLRLNLEQSTISSPAGSVWTRMPMSKRLAIGAGFVLALGIAGLLLRTTFASKTDPTVVNAAAPAAVGPSLSTAAGGWIADWGNVGLRGKQISLLRSSQALADYRIEFQTQIDGKSVGWVFRAADPKNYYATSLETTKPGLNPKVIVAHYTQVDGEQAQRVETPLPFPVHIDTVYKVRTDIFGSQFRTYVQGQLVDSWSDNRFRTGGFGLQSERTERSPIRMLQLFELKAGK
jgi:hypothetical protein